MAHSLTPFAHCWNVVHLTPMPGGSTYLNKKERKKHTLIKTLPCMSVITLTLIKALLFTQICCHIQCIRLHYTWSKWCIVYYLWAVHELMLWQLWFGKGSFDAVWLRAPCAGMLYFEWLGMDRTGQPHHHHPLRSCDSQGFSVCICCIDVYLFLCGGVVMNFFVVFTGHTRALT